MAAVMSVMSATVDGHHADEHEVLRAVGDRQAGDGGKDFSVVFRWLAQQKRD